MIYDYFTPLELSSIKNLNIFISAFPLKIFHFTLHLQICPSHRQYFDTYSGKSRKNKMSDGFQFSCLTSRVLLLFVLAHSHTVVAYLDTVIIISNTNTMTMTSQNICWEKACDTCWESGLWIISGWQNVFEFCNIFLAWLSSVVH